MPKFPCEPKLVTLDEQFVKMIWFQEYEALHHEKLFNKKNDYKFYRQSYDAYSSLTILAIFTGDLPKKLRVECINSIAIGKPV